MCTCVYTHGTVYSHQVVGDRTSTHMLLICCVHITRICMMTFWYYYYESFCTTVCIALIYTTSHCTSHDSSEYMTGHAMLLRSVHCHIVNILICVRGLTVRSGACLQLSLCFALCTCDLPFQNVHAENRK